MAVGCRHRRGIVQQMHNDDYAAARFVHDPVRSATSFSSPCRTGGVKSLNSKFYFILARQLPISPVTPTSEGDIRMAIKAVAAAVLGWSG
jgi:hypothetical protein